MQKLKLFCLSCFTGMVGLLLILIAVDRRLFSVGADPESTGLQMLLKVWVLVAILFAASTIGYLESCRRRDIRPYWFPATVMPVIGLIVVFVADPGSAFIPTDVQFFSIFQLIGLVVLSVLWLLYTFPVHWRIKRS